MLKNCWDKRHIGQCWCRTNEKLWKAKFRSVPSAEPVHSRERQEWVFQAKEKPNPNQKPITTTKKPQTKHAYIHKRAQEFSMGVGSNNREVMTLGWRLEPEQLGYCMETADFCTGSNHCWLGTPNPYLYFFLSFFFLFFVCKAKLPRAVQRLTKPLACYKRVRASRAAERQQPGTLRGPAVPELWLPGDTGSKGTGSTWKAFWAQSLIFCSGSGKWPSGSCWLCGLVPRYPSLKKKFSLLVLECVFPLQPFL